jgi:hypothetical protein
MPLSAAWCGSQPAKLWPPQTISARAGQAATLVAKKVFSVPGKEDDYQGSVDKARQGSGKHGLKVTATGSGVTQRSFVLKSSF